MIRDQVVDKCASNSLRRRLLRETDLTLEGLLRIARSIEASDLHALQWKQLLDLQGSRSIRFLVDFRGQGSSIDEIRRRVNLDMQRIVLHTISLGIFIVQH